MGKGFAKQKKAARMMQEQLSKFQEELEQLEVVGLAGGGLVSVTLMGDHSMKRVSIKPDCIDKEDPEGLEDLIQAAYSDALGKLKEKSHEGSSSVSPGIDGLSSLLPFDFSQF